MSTNKHCCRQRATAVQQFSWRRSQRCRLHPTSFIPRSLAAHCALCLDVTAAARCHCCFCVPCCFAALLLWDVGCVLAMGGVLAVSRVAYLYIIS